MLKSILITVLTTTLCATTNRTTAADSETRPIQTTWELTSSKMSCSEDTETKTEGAKDHHKIKVIADTHFVWIDYERATGKILAMAGGTYDLKGNLYTEKIKFASEAVTNLVGKSFVFTVKVEADKFFQSGDIGEGMKLTETWTRTQAAAPQAATLAAGSSK